MSEKTLVSAMLAPTAASNVTKTENSMPAFKSTTNACLDLFFQGGAYRERSSNDAIRLFNAAYKENSEIAVMILAYLRDARQGTGERKFFREVIRYLANNNISFNVAYVPVIGRWDDLLSLFGTPLQTDALQVIADALLAEKPDGLCAKWMPRKDKFARIIREFLKLYPKDYRKLLVKHTQVVETKMCDKNWGEINYSHVPSVANIKYNKAFLRNDEDRRREFLAAAKKGDVKVHATVAFPHSIVAMMLPRGTFRISDGESLARHVTKNDTAIAMWKNLPNVVGNGSKRILVCSDVSNSMHPPYSKTADPFNMSVALGIYFSEHLKGPFNNAFITFSKKPYLQYTSGDLYERLGQVRIENPSNTNIEGIFELVLKTAQKVSLPEDQMPTDILIISDMEFDRALAYPKNDAFAVIRKMYADAGYDMPNIIFWNVNGRNEHMPIGRDARGVALVSGASPNAIRSVLDGVTTPADVMLRTVQTERYMKFVKNDS